MKLIKEINISNDKKAIIWLHLIACLMIIPLFVLFFLIGYVVTGINQVTFMVTKILWSLVYFILLIFFHEMIHGLFYKLLNSEAKIKLSFHGFGLAMSSPNTFYTSTQMIVIGLAPFFIITALLTFLLTLGTIEMSAYMFLATFHTIGCISDLYVAGILLLKYPKGSMVEDTQFGMKIYQQ